MQAPLADLWDDARAAALDEPGRLLYRSNLLGGDLRITNFGGGNTSAKVAGVDPLTGAPLTTLWVKGSGGDLGSMRLDGFATLDLARVERLKALYEGPAREDAMVDLLRHCVTGLNPRAPSIDTPLHAFVPAPHVDHVHPDAVIALAASADAERLTAEVFGGRLGFLPWRRPGFELGLQLGEMAADPALEGVVLGGHGLFTWGPTAADCYRTTLRVINRAASWLADAARRPAFGGPRRESLDPAARAAAAARLMPAIRGRIAGATRKVGHFTDAPEALEFVNAADMPALAALGTSCPDHFLRTKIRPLVVEADADGPALDAALAAYRADYAGYYDRCRRPDSPAMRDPNAVVYLIPGAGIAAFAADKATARVASEFYLNAVNVMRGASGRPT